jgi:MYXO-CTERM domain-containing protein
MKKLPGLFVATAISFAAMSSAHATSYTYSFASTVSGVAAGSGTIVTAGDSTTTPELATSLTGTFSDLFTPSGAASLVPVSSGGYFDFDNLFGGTPAVDGAGIVFSVDGKEVNLYYDSSKSTYMVDDHIVVDGVGFFDLLVPITFSFAATDVAEPGAGVLLLAGLGALGLTSRRKKQY